MVPFFLTVICEFSWRVCQNPATVQIEEAYPKLWCRDGRSQAAQLQQLRIWGRVIGGTIHTLLGLTSGKVLV